MKPIIIHKEYRHSDKPLFRLIKFIHSKNPSKIRCLVKDNMFYGTKTKFVVNYFSMDLSIYDLRLFWGKLVIRTVV